jgi:hypothetical protein
MPATSLYTILLTVLWIYLPMLLAAPKDVVALNFFFHPLTANLSAINSRLSISEGECFVNPC